MKRCSADITRANIKAAKALASIGIDFVCIPVSSATNKKELAVQFCEAMELLALDAEKEDRDSNISINEAHLRDLS